jgi:hypothetical protein
MISRKLKISRSYVNRFCKLLEEYKLIERDGGGDPLERRAFTYKVDHRLRKPEKIAIGNVTLCQPHNLRFKFNFSTKSKPISKTTNRFAHCQIKYIKSWNLRGGERSLFELQHPIIGKIGVITHPQSVEIYQAERKQIIARNIEESDHILSMAISETASRFIQEQSWNDVNLTFDPPKLVGSVHYAFKSKIAKSLVDSGQTHLQMAGGLLEIDNSLGKKLGDGDAEYSEIECCDKNVAESFDRGIRKALSLETELPAIISTAVEKEMSTRTVWTEEKAAASSERLNELFKQTMRNCISPINTELATLSAHIHAGNTVRYEIDQMMTIISQQMKQHNELEMRVDEMQESKTGLVMELLHLRNENQALKAKLGK